MLVFCSFVSATTAATYAVHGGICGRNGRTSQEKPNWSSHLRCNSTQDLLQRLFVRPADGGGSGGTRTRKPLQAKDFKSFVFTNFTTLPLHIMDLPHGHATRSATRGRHECLPWGLQHPGSLKKVTRCEVSISQCHYEGFVSEPLLDQS